MRIKIFEKLPVLFHLALRLCCKQLKWEIDNLVGLQIAVRSARSDCENLGWIKHILIRKLTLQYNDWKKHNRIPTIQYSYPPLNLRWPWISFLANGGFTNLNRLSLSGPELAREEDLATILTAVSTLSSITELSLDFTVFYFSQENESISSNLTQTEIAYNFLNLTTLNLIFVFKRQGDIYTKCTRNLKSIRQMHCPHLKFLSAKLHIQYVDDSILQRTMLIWYLELLEKFSNSLQYLKIEVISIGLIGTQLRRDWEFLATMEEKAFIVGSQLRNVKEIDIVFYNAEVSVWTNFFRGIRRSLEKLKIRFSTSSVWEMYKESALLKKNSLPNLKSLTVTWNSFNLDLKKITQVSDQLERLELHPPPVFGKIINSDWIPLSLKKLVLPDSLPRMDNLAFLKESIAANESLIVQHDKLINIEVAEYLGAFLTKPNFIWRGIECWNEEQLEAASALCRKFGIPYEKLYKKDNNTLRSEIDSVIRLKKVVKCQRSYAFSS